MFKRFSHLMLSGLAVAGAAAPTAEAAVATFQQGMNGYTSGLDTSLYRLTPEHNYGGATDLFNLASGNVATPNGQIFLKFNDIFGNGPGQVPVGATINSASVTLVSRTDSIGDGTIHKSFWSPVRIDVPNYGDNDGPADIGEVTYQKRAQGGDGWGDASTGSDGPIRNQDFFGTGETVQINYNSGPDLAITFASAGLTSIVQNWASGARPNYGFHIGPHGGPDDNDQDNYGGTATFFYSNEAANSSFHPLLTIDYVPEPASIGLLGLAAATLLGRRRDVA